MKVYYSHPLTLYNTEREKEDIRMLEFIFGPTDVVNPNNPVADALYKENYSMSVFFDAILLCEALAFRALPFGKISAGVAAEIKYAKEHNIVVIELPNFLDRELSIEDTRTYLRECGYR